MELNEFHAALRRIADAESLGAIHQAIPGANSLSGVDKPEPPEYATVAAAVATFVRTNEHLLRREDRPVIDRINIKLSKLSQGAFVRSNAIRHIAVYITGDDASVDQRRNLDTLMGHFVKILDWIFPK